MYEQKIIENLREFSAKYQYEDQKLSETCFRAADAIEELQSQLREEVRINLNENVKVHLTLLGKDIYYHQFDELNQELGRIICKPSFPKEDADRLTEFQLWAFIELYGDYIGMGKPNVISPLEIIYKLPKEET